MFASARMAATLGDVVNVDGEGMAGGDVGVGVLDDEDEGCVGGGVGMMPKARGGGIVDAEAAGAVKGMVS